MHPTRTDIPTNSYHAASRAMPTRDSGGFEPYDWPTCASTTLAYGMGGSCLDQA